MFPLEKILFALASDSRATKYILESIKPKVKVLMLAFYAELGFNLSRLIRLGTGKLSSATK